MPAQWSSPTPGPTTNLLAADFAWWKTFGDPEFDSLIERGVRSNLDLRLAGARVREARAARGVVAADFWPSANANGSFTRTRVSQNGFPPFPPGTPLEGNIYQAGFDAAWELDVFGGTRRAVEAANAGIAAAEYGRARDVVVSLLGEAGAELCRGAKFPAPLAITRSNIQAQQEALDLIRDRFKAGLTSELDVQQATTLLATTEAEVPSLETSFKAAAHRLGVLLAQPPETLLLELAGDAPIPVAPPAVPAGLPSALLLRRPDTRVAERELAAATAPGLAWPPPIFIPKFSLTGDVGLQSVSASDWFTAGSRFWSAGPTAQWRIFDAGRIRANIRVQNARQEQALVQYENRAHRAGGGGKRAHRLCAGKHPPSGIDPRGSKQRAGAGHRRPALPQWSGRLSAGAGVPAFRLSKPGHATGTKRPGGHAGSHHASTRPSAAAGRPPLKTAAAVL